MVLSGPPTPVGGSQNVSPSLRSNSGVLEGGPVPSQATFPSLASPRPQMNNMNMLGNMPNMSSLLSQSFGNSSLISGAELDPLSNVGNGMGYSTPSSSSLLQGNPGTSGQFQGRQFQNPSNHMMPDQSPSQQLESQNLNSQQAAQQFSGPPRAPIGGLAGLGPVKLEPQMISDQLQSMKNMSAIKLEPQQIPSPSMRNLPNVKMESQQHSDSQLFLEHQRELMQLARQPSSLGQLSPMQQQRLFQFQQQQQHQQQLMKALPPQRALLPQQFQQQSMALRSSTLKSGYEPGMCAKRLTHYTYQQRHRPEDNNIEFWRKFVDEYFARSAKKKWCVSMYGSGRQTTGVFPQDVWHCDICNRKPGRGFEATFEVLPRLFKIKYESGTLEELLYVDMPREYQNSSGQIVLDYAKAIQESIFDQLRVVREGQLRVIFSPDLKICSWEFCARRHEELIPRRLLLPQVNQLGAVAQKYQAATQNANPSVTELQNNCNLFLSSTRQLAKALEVALVNDLGYPKRFVRCLQISEVVNFMKDLIDYSWETRTGPMESLTKFPRRAGNTHVSSIQARLPEEQQLQHQGQPSINGNHPSSSPKSSPMQLPSTSNGNNQLNPASASGPSSSAIPSLHHQNSMNNSRQHNSMSNASSPYNGVAQNQSPVSSGSIPPTQSGNSNNNNNNSNNTLQASQGVLSTTSHVGAANSLPNATTHQPEPEANGMAQSSVQKILQNMISNDVRSGNGALPPSMMNPGHGLGSLNNGLLGNGGYGSMGSVSGGFGQSAMLVNGLRAAMGNNNNNSLMNGRVGMSSMIRDRSLNQLQQQPQQQDLGTQLTDRKRARESNDEWAWANE